MPKDEPGRGETEGAGSEVTRVSRWGLGLADGVAIQADKRQTGCGRCWGWTLLAVGLGEVVECACEKLGQEAGGEQ